MTLKRHYSLICDSNNCHNKWKMTEDSSMMLTDIWRKAKRDGWLLAGDDHYCPKCWEESVRKRVERSE